MRLHELQAILTDTKMQRDVFTCVESLYMQGMEYTQAVERALLSIGVTASVDFFTADALVIWLYYRITPERMESVS